MLLDKQHGRQDLDCLNTAGSVSLLYGRWKCSDWFRGKNSKTNLAISRHFVSYRWSYVPLAYTRWRLKRGKYTLVPRRILPKISPLWQSNWCSYIVSCHCNRIISGKVYSFDLKLGEPKLHTIRKI